MNETINWRATITWDNMTTVVENGVEVARVYEDNRVEFDWCIPNLGADE